MVALYLIYLFSYVDWNVWAKLRSLTSETSETFPVKKCRGANERYLVFFVLQPVSPRHMHNQRIRDEPRSEGTLGCCLSQDLTPGRSNVQGRAGRDQTEAIKGWFLLPFPTDTHAFHAWTMQCCGRCPDLQSHVTTGQQKPGCGDALIPSLATDTLFGYLVQCSIFSCAGIEGALKVSTESLMDHFDGPSLAWLVVSLLLPMSASIRALLNLMVKAGLHKEINQL